MTLAELIKLYKTQTGLTNVMIGKKLNVSSSTVGRWLKGEVTSLQSETLSKLSNLMNIDVQKALENDFQAHKKPILGTVKAGYDFFAEENIEGYIDVNDSDNKQGNYFLRVTGNSMEQAHIFDGDLVYVQKCEDVPSGSIAVVMIGDEATIKKVIIKENLLILEAANPNVENRYFTPEEVNELNVRIIGRVLYCRTNFI